MPRRGNSPVRQPERSPPVEYTYTVTDADGDTDTETFNITITQDNTPSFGSGTIADRVHVKDIATTSVTLPAATGGDTPLTYSLSPTLPTGMSFNATSRELSGTPSVTKAQTTYTYTVTDKDNDTATLTFKLTVEADTNPSLSGTVSNQSYHQNSAVTALTLPAATSGNAPLTYTLARSSGTPALPPGLTFNASTRQLTGYANRNAVSGGVYLHGDGCRRRPRDTETFNITITQDNTPSFGSSTIADRVHVKDIATTSVTLPAATGGDAAADLFAVSHIAHRNELQRHQPRTVRHAQRDESANHLHLHRHRQGQRYRYPHLQADGGGRYQSFTVRHGNPTRAITRTAP